MTYDPAQGGRKPPVKQIISVDLFKIFSLLGRLLGIDRGKKALQKTKGG